MSDAPSNQPSVNQPSAEALPSSDMQTLYAMRLRAKRAEKALAHRESQLARILQMADSWERAWGGKAVKTDFVVSALRTTINRT